jgi:hypothetical protein
MTFLRSVAGGYLIGTWDHDSDHTGLRRSNAPEHVKRSELTATQAKGGWEGSSWYAGIFQFGHQPIAHPIAIFMTVADEYRPMCR